MNNETPSHEEASTRTFLRDKSVMLSTPQSLTSISSTAKGILDALREKHKVMESQKAKKIHPGELLTLDKLQEALAKYSNLSEQSKSVQAIDQTLKQIADPESKTKYVYLYPFLIRNANKVNAKIAMIAPQTSHEVNVKNYREACLDYSKQVIDLILSNRAKRIKEINEDEPGNFLFQNNKSGAEWLYPNNCSLEAEIGLLIKRAFKPYAAFLIKDFVDDFIDYGNEVGKLNQIAPNYHMIIDEIQLKDDGSYVRQPELVIHYRAQADGFEKFVMQHLRKLIDEQNLTDFRNRLNVYKRDQMDSAEPGRKQSREKIKLLIQIVKEFPFSKINTEYSKNVQATCQSSIRILEKLIDSMNNLLDRKYDASFAQLKSNLIQLIADRTRSDLTLTPLNLKEEVEHSGVKDPEKIQELAEKLKSEITKLYGVYEDKNEDGSTSLYTVDQSFMASVLHKLATLKNDSNEYQKQYNYAKIINNQLEINKDPKLNSNIKEEFISNLRVGIRKMEDDEQERKRKEEFQKKFNLSAGFMTLIGSMLFTFVVSFAEGGVGSLLIGIPMSFGLAFLAAIMFKKRENKDETQNLNSQSAEAVEITQTKATSLDKLDKNEKEEKLNAIANVASTYVFPARYQKVEDKVYDSNSLKSKIQSCMDDIKKTVPILAKEEDTSKVFSSIEYALLTHSIVIAIPPDIVPPGKQRTMIISKNDFKAPLFRNQLAEKFREEANKVKYDKALVKYYTFLINTLELEYYKFLPRKK